MTTTMKNGESGIIMQRVNESSVKLSHAVVNQLRGRKETLRLICRKRLGFVASVEGKRGREQRGRGEGGGGTGEGYVMLKKLQDFECSLTAISSCALKQNR